MAIGSTHYNYPWRDGQAELAWVARLNIKMVLVYPHLVTHPSTNWAPCRAAKLIVANALPLALNRH